MKSCDDFIKDIKEGRMTLEEALKGYALNEIDPLLERLTFFSKTERIANRYAPDTYDSVSHRHPSYHPKIENVSDQDSFGYCCICHFLEEFKRRNGV